VTGETEDSGADPHDRGVVANATWDEAFPPSRDTMLAGEVILWQPSRKRGYRFNLDPVLLAGFAPPAKHVLDLGAGVGVVGILMLAYNRAQQVTAVEIQEELATLARQNGRENNVAERFEVIHVDLRRAVVPKVDAVVFNPPYFKLGEGRPSSDLGRSIARQERCATLADFVATASRAVLPGGSVSAIIRMARADELCELLRQRFMGVVRLRDVVARKGEAAAHVLIEARAGVVIQSDAKPQREEPLIVHVGEGRDYSDEVAALLEERKWHRDALKGIDGP